MIFDARAEGAIRGRWAVGSMFFINGFIVGSWAVQIPGIMQRLELNESQFGLMILMFGLGSVVAMTIAGRLMVRFGSRPVLLPCAFAAVAAFPVVVTSPSPAIAAVVMALFGAAIGGMDVCMNANAVTVERRMARAIMSSSHGFWSLGGFLGGGLGGFAIASAGANIHAIAVSVITAALGLAASSHIIAGDKAAAQAGLEGRFVLPRSGAVYAVGLIALICIVPEAAARNWAALFLERELGADIGIAGLAFALFAGAMALMRFLGDGLRNNFGAVSMYRLSAAATAVGLTVASLAAWPFLSNFGFALAGLGAANLIPITFSAAGNHPGVSPATGMSITMAMCSAGMLAVPSSMGLVAQNTGFTPLFLGVAALVAFTALFAGILRNADFRA